MIRRFPNGGGALSLLGLTLPIARTSRTLLAPAGGRPLLPTSLASAFWDTVLAAPDTAVSRSSSMTARSTSGSTTAASRQGRS
jgi:hypothetical protein